MAFIGFHLGREIAPPSPGAGKYMAEFLPRGVQRFWLVESPGRDRPDPRDRLQRHAEVRTASRAKVDLQPAPRLVRLMAIHAGLDSGKVDILFREHHFGAERGSSAPL